MRQDSGLSVISYRACVQDYWRISGLDDNRIEEFAIHINDGTGGEKRRRLVCDKSKPGCPVRPSRYYRKFIGRNWSKCYLCKRRMPQVIDRHKESGLDGSGQFRETVSLCSKCGWWRKTEIWDDTNSFYTPSEEVYIYESIVQRFFEGDADLPVSLLNEHIRKNPDRMKRLSPRSLEKLVGSVFSDFYNCTVEHCGGPNDGGIDLVMIHRGEPIVIQVKRRSTEKKEPVSTVREFLGAMVVADAKHGVFVTSAPSFSKSAQSIPQRIKDQGRVESIDLVDLDRFIAMINATDHKFDAPWEDYRVMAEARSRFTAQYGAV